MILSRLFLAAIFASLASWPALSRLESMPAVVTEVSVRPNDDSELRIRAQAVDDQIVTMLRPMLREGRKKVERFFGRPFPMAFEVEVFADRAAFDAYLFERWKVPKSEPWMVASGVADKLTILSPRVWKSQATEHDSKNLNHIRELVTHELVHVYHGQHCPKPDFEGMDEMAWFAEGLAVFASGQLESSHRTAAAQAIKYGKAPDRLSDAWTGRFRYGVSGSIVEFIDTRFGREVIRKLLSLESTEAGLASLGISEAQLLNDWRDSASQRPAR